MPQQWIFLSGRVAAGFLIVALSGCAYNHCDTGSPISSSDVKFVQDRINSKTVITRSEIIGLFGAPQKEDPPDDKDRRRLIYTTMRTQTNELRLLFVTTLQCENRTPGRVIVRVNKDDAVENCYFEPN